MRFIKHFEATGEIAKGCNSSFICLLPKVNYPLNLVNYRPISLIGCMYKILAKVLATRLERVIGYVVINVQSAYIKGRNILEGPLVINEIYAWSKNSKEKLFLFKVDFENAFDSINWIYLDSVISQVNSREKWRNWILGCLSSSYASILINGSPTNEFKISKGVKQDDPLSPLLFIIAMEGLSVAMNTAIEKDRFRGKKIGRDGPSISHLLYAGDALFVSESDIKYMRNLARILRCFHASSGLQVNFHKSQVFGVGVDIAQIAGWAKEYGCVSGSFPFTYMGVPFGANMNLKKHWIPIIDRFKSRFSSWKIKHISFDGRLTLIKFVLSSLPLYYFSLFNAPICVINKLEQIRRKFLCGGIESNNKINWVAWSTVLASKQRGGLDVGLLRAQNYALLMKWWWRLKENENNIWKDVVNSIHKIQSKTWCNMTNQSISGAWKNIIKVESAIIKLSVNFFDIFKIKIGNAKQVSFWKDVWLGSMSFQDRFPALFAIEVQKGCTISNRILSDRWNWLSNPCNSVCLHEFRELLHILNAVSLKDEPDRLACIISSDEKYSVHKVRCLIDEKITTAGFVGMIWLNSVPLKVNCFAWRVGLGRIPVAKLLQDRGVQVGSTSCKVCNLGDEDLDHVFIGCQRVIETRRLIFSWCGIQMPILNSVPELFNFAAKWGNCSKEKKIFTFIIYAMLWSCWKARNEMVFNNRLKSSMKIAEEIIDTSFSWFKRRKKIIVYVGRLESLPISYFLVTVSYCTFLLLLSYLLSLK